MSKPIVIAHRGASGYLPEHTLEAVTLAYMMGADFIEQDLVLTQDHELIVLHDIHLDTVSDVEQRYPDRARGDGRFYALDFTLREIKTLRVHERTEVDGTPVYADRYQGRASFKIPTFAEEIEFISNLNRQLGKNIGYYPEIKAPAWHMAQGYDISQITVDLLRLHSLDDADQEVFVQCFDFEENKRLRNQLGLEAKLIQLIGDNAWEESSTDYEYLMTREGLAEVAKIAQGIGPWIPQLVELNTGHVLPLAEHAHQAGLEIHPYTFRKEELDQRTATEFLDLMFNQVKVDGIFTDFTDIVVEFLAQQQT